MVIGCEIDPICYKPIGPKFVPITIAKIVLQALMRRNNWLHFFHWPVNDPLMLNLYWISLRLVRQWIKSELKNLEKEGGRNEVDSNQENGDWQYAIWKWMQIKKLWIAYKLIALWEWNYYLCRCVREQNIKSLNSDLSDIIDDIFCPMFFQKIKENKRFGGKICGGYCQGNA